jgi:hypothetical protein
LQIGAGIDSTGDNTWGIDSTLTGNQAFLSRSGTLAISAGINTNGYDLTMAGDGDVAVGGMISGAGRLLKAGSGTLYLAQAAATLNNRPLVIKAGTVDLSGQSVTLTSLRMGGEGVGAPPRLVSGTGTNQPLGFLTSPNAATADATRPMGTLQFLGTGAAGAFPASNPADKLIDLVQTLRSPYRQGAVFVMNSATAATVRKFKTADGAFMFQPSLAAGQPATLLGYPLIEAEDMPDVAANSLSIAFGNFKAGYVIAERNATTILRDPYTHKPYVHFYATKRIGGQVVNSEAIKLLKFA